MMNNYQHDQPKKDEEQSLSLLQKYEQQQEQTQHSGSTYMCNQTPRHLQNQQQISILRGQSINKLLLNDRLKWSSEFCPRVKTRVLQNNLQSMEVELSYGHLITKVHIIFTEIDECLFGDLNSNMGGFGVVKYLEYLDTGYAIKCIKIAYREHSYEINHIYKEYLMCFIASVLEVGPRIYTLFGYDIVIGRDFAFFAMEKCQSINTATNNNFEKQLINNLKVLNSINFIHNDIKPANIVYSPNLGKHIFIDFGISRFVKQNPNEKTRTRFQGTLLYCSEDMKKCYTLNTAMFVNLYENDYHSLKKSLKNIETLGTNVSMNVHLIHHEWELHGDQSPTKQQNAILALTIWVLQLKFNMHHRQLTKIMGMLSEMPEVKTTVYELFQSEQSCKQIKENVQINKIVNQISKQMAQPGFKLSNDDQILNEIFGKVSKLRLASRIMPIAQILQLSDHQILRFLNNTEWVCKLFAIFDPFSTQNKLYFEQDLTMKKQIINIIYEVHNKQKVSQFTFTGQRAHFLIALFYEKLKHLKNVKILTKFRMIFISLEDWPRVEQIQDIILQEIEDETMKCLKLIQFSLFWDSFYQQFQHRNKQKWRLSLNSLKQDTSIIELVRSISPILFSTNNHQTDTIALKSGIVKQIQNLQKLTENTIYEQVGLNIECMYFQICEMKERKILKQQKMLKNFSTIIYSLSFFATKIHPQSLKNHPFNEYQQLIIAPTCACETYSDLFPSPQHIHAYIQYYFTIYDRRSEFFQFFTMSILSKGCKYKCCINQLMENMERCAPRSEQSTIYHLFSKFMFISTIFQFLVFNQQMASPQQKLTSKQYQDIVVRIKNLLYCLTARDDAQNVIKRSKDLQIMLQTAQVKIQLQMKRSQFELQSQIIEIMQTFKPLPYRNQTLLSYFFIILPNMMDKIRSQKPHFCQEIILHLAHQYLINKTYRLFVRQTRVMADAIYIKNKKQQSQYSLWAIQSFIEHIDSPKFAYDRKKTAISLMSAVDVFCRTLPKNKIAQIYKGLSQPIRSTGPFFQYFLFSLFLVVINDFDLSHKIKIIVKTCLQIETMPKILQTFCKPILFYLCRTLDMYSTARKKFICVHLEMLTDKVKKIKVLYSNNISQLVSCKINKKIIYNRLLNKFMRNIEE